MSERKKTVTIIPAKPLAVRQAMKRQLRVAAYCRVSTEEEEQQSSYEAQRSYYTDKIMTNPEWTMAGIFADEGITGTSAKKRPEFLHMIHLCKQRKIDLVLTKSISRFSRNTVDCLKYIRILRGLGIGVVFEKENINTLESDSELIITLLGAFAQSESESISKNVSWGIRQAMREGKTHVQFEKMYGYGTDSSGNPQVIPEEGNVVKRIFERFLLGDSLRMIRDMLNADGIPYRNEKEWTMPAVRAILTSEKYCGDVLMQKTYISDCISKKVVKNTGQLPMYLVRDNHPAIVSRDKYNAAQAELARRNALKSPSPKQAPTGRSCYTSKYALSERLVCGECGTLYRRCSWQRNGKKKIVWRCISRLDYGTKYCHNSHTLEESSLQQAILAAVNSAMPPKERMAAHITDAMVEETLCLPGDKLTLGEIKQKIQELQDAFSAMLQKAAENPGEDYTEQFRTNTEELAALKKQRDALEAYLREKGAAYDKVQVTKDLLNGLSPQLTQWDENWIRQLVHTVKVISAEHIRVYLNDGTEIDQAVDP